MLWVILLYFSGNLLHIHARKGFLQVCNFCVGVTKEAGARCSVFEIDIYVQIKYEPLVLKAKGSIPG